MARVKRGVTAHAKHKKVYKSVKGQRGRRKNTIRAAKAAVDKAAQYSYRDRKNNKRNFRALWIQRINAAVREFGLTYGRFIDGLNRAGIEIDRKVLSELAIHEPAAFKAIVEQAKAALAGLTASDMHEVVLLVDPAMEDLPASVRRACTNKRAIRPPRHVPQ